MSKNPEIKMFMHSVIEEAAIEGRSVARIIKRESPLKDKTNVENFAILARAVALYDFGMVVK